MTVQEAALLYGVSKQAIYQRLKAKGYDIKQLKDSSGSLTEDGESILAQLFDHTSVTGDGDSTPQQSRKEPAKQETPSLLQAQKRVAELEKQVDGLQREVDFLTKQVDALKEERDYLRRALDQAQQLHAMTMKQMLPPSPAERKGALSWLTSRFKKNAPAADQVQTEQSGNNQ